MSDPLLPHGLQPAKLPCPWNSPGKNTEMGCHFILQGSSPARDQAQVSCIAGRFFTVWATRIPSCNKLINYNGKESEKILFMYVYIPEYCKSAISVQSDSLRHHGLQYARLPCPLPGSWNLLKLMSIESVMPSNHLILCCPLLLPPSVFPSIRVFSNE